MTEFSEVRLLNTKQLAELFGVSVVTLEQWRLKGKGPKFIKVGRCVRYRMADVLGFQEDAVRRSTSDTGPAATRR